MKLLVILLLLISCGTSHKNTPSEGQYSLETEKQLTKEKAEVYLSLSSQIQDGNGFIDTDHCDSLMFSGLYGSAGGTVNLATARDSNGQWFRRPLNYEACYPGHSASTISRDAFTGVLWYIWENKRLDLAEDLYSYGVGHTWIMGSGDISTLLFTPIYQSTLAEIIYKLGGTNHPISRSLSFSYDKHVGFEAHLDVLMILLRADIMGSVTDKGLELLKYNYDRNPKNALFSYGWHKYSDGNQKETYDALLDEDMFPSNRLPASADRCEAWVWQRDGGADWEPCDQGKTHSGGDLLFIYKLLGE